MLQYLGLVLVIASWIGGYYLVNKWRNKDLLTISKHAASNKSASLLFAAILIGLGLAFYYWLVKWLTPHLGLTSVFQVILAITILCQVLSGLIPDTLGWQRSVHRWAAYTMAILYLPLSLLITSSPQLSFLPRIICAALSLYMLISFTLVVIMGKAKAQYLFFQASYIVAFQLVILSAAYL